MIFQQNVPTKLKKLEKQVLDLQSELDAKDREIKVMQAEIDSMACVIARDRERIRAEGSAYARARAESENVGQHHQGSE